MSQDSNLLSAFKRPRETIKPADRSLLHGTGIPLPASGTSTGSRPSNYRMSMVPRPGGIPQSSIGGAGSADSVMTTVKRHKSYAPSSSQPPQSSRRSSQFGRASIGASGSFFTGVTSAVALKDPRPLKNSTYQAKMAEEVTNYLVLNGFEASTGHSLSPNAMRKPTQKDFYNVFQWLYKKLDPNYRFTSPKIENEVIPLLKAIRYPYASSITKTQLTAVGSGNAWPIFLGLLNWMVQLITVVDRVQSGEYDDAAEIEGDMFADKITFRYLTQCYNAWLRENDDHSEFEREMAEAFQERDAKFLEEFHELEADNERLKRQLEELEKDAQVLPKLQEEKAVLENDRKKYLHWIEKVEAKTKKTNEVIERIVPQLEQMKEDQEKAAKLKDTLQAQVDAQGLLPPDIDRLNSKRDKINQGLAQISIKAQEVQSNLDEREAQAQTNFEALERAVSRYNKLAYQIGITPNTANNAKNKDYELHISPSADLQASEGNKLLLENRTGYQPSQILNLDLRHDVKPFLVSLIKEIKDKILDSQDEFSKNQELIERVTEGLQEHKDEIETMEARIQAANNEYQQLKETTQQETHISSAEIEKQAAINNQMRTNMNKGLLEAETKLATTSREHDELVEAAAVVREKLHSDIHRMVEDVVNFKLNIQRTLEEHELNVDNDLREHD